MKPLFFVTILFFLCAGLFTRANAQIIPDEYKPKPIPIDYPKATFPNTTKAIPAKLDGDAGITNKTDKTLFYSYSRDNINWTKAAIESGETQVIRGVKNPPTYFRIVTNDITINYLISDKFYVILWNKERKAWDLYENIL